ncbi:MAG: DMT family transporter, partial [Alphaproteobacteria bacterium]|nr:DMT family transporter [Alphaproteobacteria bacterium]
MTKIAVEKILPIGIVPRMNFASRPALTAILLALTSFSLFSVGDTAIKALSVHYDTVTIAFYIGTMIVGLTLLLTPFMGGVRRIITLPDRKFHILRGCVLTLQFYLMIYAFSVMSLAKAYALLFAAPLITVLLAWLMLKEKPGPVQTVLIAIGFAGVLLILRPG